jgi:hypothetical protein
VPARPRVGLATCAALPDLDPDDALLVPALAALGVEAVPAVWDDPALDWDAFDLVVVRSTWDYVPRREEYLAWARSVPRLENPAEVLGWNTAKTYLRELAAAGVPVVPTTWLLPGDGYEPPAGEHVVKPVVSAGASDTGRYTPGEDSRPHVQRLLSVGRAAMVQPYVHGIETEGETALVFFLDRLSHAARKAPVLVPGLDDPELVEITSRTPSDSERRVAEAALAAVAQIRSGALPTASGGDETVGRAPDAWTPPLLYARVDLVPGPEGTPMVIELELTEPSLFLATSPRAADRFAAAVVERLRQAAR